MAQATGRRIFSPSQIWLGTFYENVYLLDHIEQKLLDMDINEGRYQQDSEIT